MPYKDLKQQREYQRKWMAARRRVAIEAFGGKCSECSTESNLEFDHTNRLEKVSHRFWSWAWHRIWKELSKCVLLCKECHLHKALSNKEYLPTDKFVKYLKTKSS